MSTFHQLREGLHEAWDTMLEGWQKLYRRAAGAITRFTPGKQDKAEISGQQVSLRSIGWGVLAAEVYDGGDNISIRLEIPGMKKDDFDVQVVNNYLIVRGEKLIEREENDGRYHIAECAYGQFERAIPLHDEVESDKANASYKDGVLKIDLPKVTRNQNKKIDIKAS